MRKCFKHVASSNNCTRRLYNSNKPFASNNNTSTITESLLKDFAIFKYNNEQEKVALECLTEIEKNAILEQRLLSFAHLPLNVTRNDITHYLSKLYIPRVAFAHTTTMHHLHADSYKMAQQDLLFPHNHVYPQYDATGCFTGKVYLLFDDFYDSKNLLIRHERRKAEIRKPSDATNAYNNNNTMSMQQSELLQVNTVDPVEYAMNKHFCQTRMACANALDFAKCFLVWNPYKVEVEQQVICDALQDTGMEKCVALQDFNYLVRFESEAEMYRAMRVVQFGKAFVTRAGSNNLIHHQLLVKKMV